jgi:hypothetical protein
MPAAFRHAILLDTLSDAERRSVREQYTCRHQFDNINNSAEQPLVLLDCITTPPTTWRYDFVHTFVVAEDDIPPNVGRFGVDWEQYLQDGGATARQACGCTSLRGGSRSWAVAHEARFVTSRRVWRCTWQSTLALR